MNNGAHNKYLMGTSIIYMTRELVPGYCRYFVSIGVGTFGILAEISFDYEKLKNL